MIDYFVRHPTAANLLMLVIILLGVLGLSSLTREVFPEFSSDFINVQVVYRGASAEEVEETICRPIEEELEGIQGIDEIRSTSREGVGLVTVEVADGYDVAEVLRDVENAVEQIDYFPADVEEPVVWEVEQMDPVCSVAIWSEGMPEKDLLALGETIKTELLAIDEVSRVRLAGFSEQQIRIEVRQEDLLARGLTIADVAREIQTQSVDLPTGSVETGQREIKIRLTDQRRRAEDFRDLPILVSPTGARILLRDVATVRDTFKDEWTRTTFQGHRSVGLEIQKTRSEDTIRVRDAVKTYVEQRRASLPPGVSMQISGDWAVYVEDRLGMLVENGIWGFILVFLTLWLFLQLRLAIWVAVGIPISFLGTLYVMHQLDMSLNMISMFSLILVLGIIVDDAIVIGENIYAHYCRGTPPAEAAVKGTKEVSLGVIASMLTTVAVFMPLLTMQGQIGKILRVMPLGVITALSVSLVEAFLVLPNHLTHSLERARKQPRRIRAAIDQFVWWFTRRVYGPVLDWSARRPLIPLATMITLFLVSLGLVLGGRLGFQLFPELDGDFLVADVELPAGTSLAATQKVIKRLEDALDTVAKDEKFARQPGGKQLIRTVSTLSGVGWSLNDDPVMPETGSHLAQVVVELLVADERTVTCNDILNGWRQAVGDVPDVVSLTFEQMQVTPGGKPIDIQLQGRDLYALKQASLDLQTRVATYPGVRNVADNLRPGKQEVLLRLKPAGRRLGITSAALATQLRNAFWGSIAEEFQFGRDTFEVQVEFAPHDRRSLADLEDFKLRAPDGRMVPLQEVATAETVRGFSQIIRVDGRRSISITAELDTRKGNAGEINADLQDNYFPDFLRRHPGVSINLEGQRKETAETGMSVARGFVIGVCIIFLILSFVFKSFIEPLIVMTAIPFGLIGTVVGHLVTGIDLTMPSMVGFVSLSGIVVNDSILLVEFIKLRLAEGMPVHQAVHQAGMDRFRPVLLTTATTVAGLLPIVLETSFQAQILKPMAISIAFGLMFSTILVLLLVPCLYGVLSRLGWSQKIEVK